MRIRNFLKPLSFIPAILIMYMIFQFSAQPGEVSSAVSYKVSYKIVETADHIFDVGLEEWQMQNWAVRINGVTRKLAHMTEYFMLAVAVAFPLYVYGLHGIALLLLVGTICIGFAAGDEYHQSMIDGRSPSVRDVGIDSFGVLVGIILVRIVGWTGRMTIFRTAKPKRAVATAGSPVYKEETHYQEDPSYYKEPVYYDSAPSAAPVTPPSQTPPSSSSGSRNAETYSHEPEVSCNDEDASTEDLVNQALAALDEPEVQSTTGETYDDDVRRTGYDEYPSDAIGDAVDPDDESSDELSDDMPFSKLFRKK